LEARIGFSTVEFLFYAHYLPKRSEEFYGTKDGRHMEYEHRSYEGKLRSLNIGTKWKKKEVSFAVFLSSKG
jgi:hypothetical protein